MADWTFGHLTVPTQSMFNTSTRYSITKTDLPGKTNISITNGGVSLGAFQVTFTSGTINVFNSSQDRPATGQMYPRFNK